MHLIVEQTQAYLISFQLHVFFAFLLHFHSSDASYTYPHRKIYRCSEFRISAFDLIFYMDSSTRGMIF